MHLASEACVDDVVISGGVNVSTRTVAARLQEHDAIAAAEVVGLPDDEWGQRVVAIIVAPAGAPSLEAVRDFVGATLPRTWAPREVVVLDTIPLLSNGKVDRVKLEQLAATREARP